MCNLLEVDSNVDASADTTTANSSKIPYNYEFMKYTTHSFIFTIAASEKFCDHGTMVQLSCEEGMWFDEDLLLKTVTCDYGSWDFNISQQECIGLS